MSKHWISTLTILFNLVSVFFMLLAIRNMRQTGKVLKRMRKGDSK